MDNEEKGNSLEPEDISSTGTGSKLETRPLPDVGPDFSRKPCRPNCH